MGTVIDFASRRAALRPDLAPPPVASEVAAIPNAPEPWHMRRVEVQSHCLVSGRRGRVVGFDPVTGCLLVALDYDPRRAAAIPAAALRLLEPWETAK